MESLENLAQESGSCSRKPNHWKPVKKGLYEPTPAACKMGRDIQMAVWGKSKGPDVKTSI